MILSDTPGIIKPAYEMQDDELREISFWRCWCADYMVEIGEQELKDEAF
jgi:GTP-binding protein Era